MSTLSKRTRHMEYQFSIIDSWDPKETEIGLKALKFYGMCLTVLISLSTQ